MTTPDRDPLTPDVIRRKAAIFNDLTGVLDERIRARRNRQATAAASLFGVATLAVALLLTRTAPNPSATPAPPTPIASDPFADPRFTIVHALAEAPPLERISDDELATELQAAGFKGGFARTNTGVFIASR